MFNNEVTHTVETYDVFSSVYTALIFFIGMFMYLCLLALTENIYLVMFQKREPFSQMF